MKTVMRCWMLAAFLCLISGLTWTQQPGLPLPKPQLPGQDAPDAKPPRHQKLSNKDVGEKLRKGFDTKNAPYAGSHIKAAVGDQNVTLTGTVNSEAQREMALQLARAYADDRTIVDKLVIQ